MRGFLLIIIVVLSSCKKENSNKNSSTFNFRNWDNKLEEFKIKYCKNTKYIKEFNSTIKKRKILDNISNNINGSLLNDGIDKVVISGNAFNIGKINIMLINGKSGVGYYYVSRDIDCYQLYFSYKFNLTQGVTEEKGCVSRGENQNLKISMIIDNKGDYKIYNIISF